jgi:hypothetical protein
LINIGIPPFVAFWGELIFLTNFLLFLSWLFIFLIVYFVFRIYYSVYIIIHIRKPGVFIKLNTLVIPSLFVGLLYIVNFLFFVF